MIGAIESGESWHYAAVLLASLLVTLPLEFLGARVYRQPKRLVATIVLASTPFVLWDVAAIRAGHWSISDEFTTGASLGNMPLEELAFFVVIPLCALLTYEVVRRYLARERGALMTFPVYTALTIVAVCGAVAADLFLLKTRVTTRLPFWITVTICWFFQVFVDGWLTKADGTIVAYRSDVHTGIRVFFNTPIEDFGFAFALILLTLSVWQRLAPQGVDS